jgi:heat shock protein HslJ
LMTRRSGGRLPPEGHLLRERLSLWAICLRLDRRRLSTLWRHLSIVPQRLSGEGVAKRLPMRPPFLPTLAFTLLIAACHHPADAEAPLVGPVWIAERIGDVPAIAGAEVTLTFDTEGRSGGKAGCNTYGAGYTQDGSKLAFEAPFSTRMFCSPDALMAQERAYLDLLGRVTGYQTQGDKLQLNAADGKTIVFHKQP